LGVKGMGLAILVGSIVTAGLSAIDFFIFAPLIGGIVAGFLIKNGSIYFSLADFKPAMVGLLSGVLGALIVLIGIHFFVTPPTEGLADWSTGLWVYSIVLLFAGPFLGAMGGAVGGIARNMVKPKKHLD
jgi:hypothetical protein